jgi:hypothetical protein
VEEVTALHEVGSPCNASYCLALQELTPGFDLGRSVARWYADRTSADRPVGPPPATVGDDFGIRCEPVGKDAVNFPQDGFAVPQNEFADGRKRLIGGWNRFAGRKTA